MDPRSIGGNQDSRMRILRGAVIPQMIATGNGTSWRSIGAGIRPPPIVQPARSFHSVEKRWLTASVSKKFEPVKKISNYRFENKLGFSGNLAPCPLVLVFTL